MSSESTTAEHTGELHSSSTGGLLNWLRAAVLGANDGVVSLSGLVIGVAAAGASHGAIFTAGMAGLAAGALSMAVGEYVSVSTQRDTEMALIAKERKELADDPEGELLELAGMYQQKGLSAELAHEVASQLHAHDALAAHAETELGIDDEAFTNPWQAAVASMVAFTVGALIPLAAVLLTPASLRLTLCVVAAAVALAFTGFTSAKLGGANPWRALVRNICGGMLAMAITHGIGSLVGTQL